MASKINSSLTPAQRELMRFERDREIMQATERGSSVDEIAEYLDLSKEQVRGAIKRIITTWARELAHQYNGWLAIHLRREEKLYNAVAASAEQGSLPHVYAAQTILDREAKLMGLHAPDKLQVFGNVQHDHHLVGPNIQPQEANYRNHINLLAPAPVEVTMPTPAEAIEAELIEDEAIDE